jgi:phosphoglucomutase
MKKFFDLHVFHSRSNGFSVPVVMDDQIDDTIDIDDISDEEVIRKALDNDEIDSEDANSIDYVEEISESEFLDMGGVL